MKISAQRLAGPLMAIALAGCGTDSREGPGQKRADTATHYPRESTYDSAREAVPAMPVPMDTAIRRVPEAGKRLDAGDTGVMSPD